MDARRKRRAYWRCQIIGWALYSVLGLIFIALFPPGPPFWRFVLVYIIAAAVAIGCTHAYRHWLQGRGWNRRAPLPLFPRVIGASIVVGLAITFIMIGVYYLSFNFAFLRSDGWAWLFPALYIWIGSVFGWNLLYFGQHYFEQSRQAEIEGLQARVAAKESALRSLIAQVNPHFLFNALNSLRGLIAEDPPRAQAMVTELASLLRYALASEHQPLVTLAAELEAVEAYLQLEGIRLEDRLRCDIQVSPAARAATVPPMLVQTLVENGIKHGVAQLPRGGEIRVEADVRDGRLELAVWNSGTWRQDPGSTRLGLENARERLRLLYGDAAELEVGGDANGMVRARLHLPVRALEQEAACAP
ncbi:MAG: sensor histidine kinase [Terriglobales bacterium]